MKELTVSNRSFSGVWTVYEAGDQLPVQPVHVLLAKAGDYITDSDGVTAPVLRIYWTKNEVAARRKLVVISPFGTDVVANTAKSGEARPTIFHFDRPRQNFWNFARKPYNVRPLGWREMAVIQRICSGRDIYVSWMEVYGVSTLTLETKYKIRNSISKMFSKPDAKAFAMATLKEAMTARKLNDPEWYIEKMLSSIEGAISTAVQLQIFQMLGKAASNEEVQRLVDPDNRPALPPPNLPQLAEAPYEEIKDKPVKEEKEGLKV